MGKNWWKILTIMLLIYTFTGGLLFDVPRLNILNETIRALYFHVPMWFGMIILLLSSCIYSVMYLGNHKDATDTAAVESAIGLLIYFAYFVLRGSIDNEEQRARISAVYNIFAFAALVPLLFILPRLTDSLHPGNGGNPGFNAYDLDSRLRVVFYPAVVAWALLGIWIFA